MPARTGLIGQGVDRFRQWWLPHQVRRSTGPCGFGCEAPRRSPRMSRARRAVQDRSALFTARLRAR
ncbi:MAG TPA: hypothetical protein VGH99_12300 [Pseudonocardia sp.]